MYIKNNKIGSQCLLQYNITKENIENHNIIKSLSIFIEIHILLG